MLAPVLGAVVLGSISLFSILFHDRLFGSQNTVLKEKKPVARLFGMPRNEVLFVLLLTLIQLGFPAINVQPSFFLGLAIWAAVIILSIHVAWSSTASWQRYMRVCAVLIATAAIAWPVYYPLERQFQNEYGGSKNGKISSQPTIEVHPLFKSAQDQYDLGRPAAPYQNAGNYVGQVYYKNALAIWLHRDAKIYALPNDQEERRVYWEIDYKWLYPGDDDDVRRDLHIPPDCAPPVLGVASHWKENPAKWEWIGCREKQCNKFSEPQKIFYQTFERGKIIGPLIAQDERVQGAGIVVIHKDAVRGDRWEWEFNPDLTRAKAVCTP
jgi:hypothetical protein